MNATTIQNTAVFTMLAAAVCTASAAPVPPRAVKIDDRYSDDITDVTGYIDTLHRGKPDGGAWIPSAAQYNFKLGDGANKVRRTQLAGHDQATSWSLKVLEGGGATPFQFRNNNTPDNGPGTLMAQAALNGDDASDARVEFSAAGEIKGGGSITIGSIGIGAAAPAERRPSSGLDEFFRSEFGASSSLVLDGTEVFRQTASLWSEGSESGFMDSDTLILDATTGSTGFSMTSDNWLDPTESFAWSVEWDGSTLVTDGIDAGLFSMLGDGRVELALASAAMVGFNFTAQDDTSFQRGLVAYHLVQSAGVPAPGAAALIGLGSLAAFRRRR